MADSRRAIPCRPAQASAQWFAAGKRSPLGRACGESAIRAIRAAQFFSNLRMILHDIALLHENA